jgi:hypothetical protein
MVSLRMDGKLLERIDEERGLVPRAAWMAQACEVALARTDLPAEVLPFKRVVHPRELFVHEDVLRGIFPLVTADRPFEGPG